MAKLISLIICLLLYGCGYNEFENGTPTQPTVPEPTTTIAELTSFYKGKPVLVNREYIVHGYVSSTDKGNNFFKSFVIQDHTGAIEVMAGLYNLHNNYPPGSHIILRAYGLTMGAYNSVVQIGIENRSSNVGEVDYMGYRGKVDQHVVRDSRSAKVEPMSLELASLTKEHCGKLVTISGISLPEGTPPSAWNSSEFGSQTFNKFVDRFGNVIYVVCSAYANFASRTIPPGSLAITGILYNGEVGGRKNLYILKPREIGDVTVQ